MLSDDNLLEPQQGSSAQSLSNLTPLASLTNKPAQLSQEGILPPTGSWVKEPNEQRERYQKDMHQKELGKQIHVVKQIHMEKKVLESIIQWDIIPILFL